MLELQLRVPGRGLEVAFGGTRDPGELHGEGSGRVFAPCAGLDAMEALLGVVEVLVARHLPQDRSSTRRQREVDLTGSLANLLVHLGIGHALEEGLLHVDGHVHPVGVTGRFGGQQAL